MMAGASASYLLAHYGGYSLSFFVAIPLVLLSLFLVARLYAKIQKVEPWKNLHSGESLSKTPA